MLRNIDPFDRLALFDTLLQIMTMLIVSEDATNNDIMSELQRQDREYLEKIIENQEKILAKLTESFD